MYIKVSDPLSYTPHMDTPKVEREMRIADARNAFSEAIARARYGEEAVVFTSRGKRAAVLVSVDFYERALEALGETRVPAGS